MRAQKMENWEEHMESPFKMPDGYLSELENSIGERIAAEDKHGFKAVLKPALIMACAFGLIFGMGYGVLSLTGTLKEDPAPQENIAIIDEGLLDSRFIDFYDESEILADEEELDENYIINYLEYEVSETCLPEIYAQQP